jgi:hypothetical protein
MDRQLPVPVAFPENDLRPQLHVRIIIEGRREVRRGDKFVCVYGFLSNTDI